MLATLLAISASLAAILSTIELTKLNFAYLIASAVQGLFQWCSSTYLVFETLANATNIFQSSFLDNLALKIYSVLGIVVLFIAAYGILLKVIDPESSDEFSMEKLIKNIVKALVIIVLLPTIFSFANGFIGSIVEMGTIQKLFFEEIYDTDDDNAEDVEDTDYITKGSKIVDNTFIYVYTSMYDVTDATQTTLYHQDIIRKCADNNKCTFADAVNKASETGNLSYITAFSSNWAKGAELDEKDQVQFHPIIGTVCGFYIIFVLLSFCFDLAVRIIKLLFYQLIAPICVICMILPGSKKEIYTKWKSLTIKTYLVVLIRIMAMCLGVFMVALIMKLVSNTDTITNTYPYCDKNCVFIIQLILLLSIFGFIKQIPKLFEDLLGEETGLAKTLKEKFKDTGVVNAAKNIANKTKKVAQTGARVGSAVGGAASGAARNAKDAFGKKSNWINPATGKMSFGSWAKNAAKGTASTIAGGFAGAKQGFKNGKNVTNLKGMAQTAQEAGRAANEKAREHAAFFNRAGSLKGAFGLTFDGAKQKLGAFVGINDPAVIQKDMENTKKIVQTASDLKTKVENSLDEFARKGKQFRTEKRYIDETTGKEIVKVLSTTEELEQKRREMEAADRKWTQNPTESKFEEAYYQAKKDFEDYKKKFVNETLSNTLTQDISALSKMNFTPDVTNFLLDAKSVQEGLSFELKKSVDNPYLSAANKDAVIHTIVDNQVDNTIKDLKVDLNSAPIEEILKKFSENLGYNNDVESLKNSIGFNNTKVEVENKVLLEIKQAELAKNLELMDAELAQEQERIQEDFKKDPVELYVKLRADKYGVEVTSEVLDQAKIDYSKLSDEEHEKVLNDYMENQRRVIEEKYKQAERDIQARFSAPSIDLHTELAGLDAKMQQEFTALEDRLYREALRSTLDNRKDEMIAKAYNDFAAKLEQKDAQAVKLYDELYKEIRMTGEKIDKGDIYRDREREIDGINYKIKDSLGYLKDVGKSRIAEAEYELARLKREESKKQ